MSALAVTRDGDLAARFSAFRRLAEDTAEVAAVRRRVETLWHHPRDAASAARYHRRTLPSGRYLIAGAGPQGDDLAAALASRTDVEIVGFVDRKAHIFNGRGDLPVVTAADSGDLPIIVANRIWEPDMIDDLIHAGIAPDRLVATYTAEGYTAFAPPASDDDPPIPDGGVRTLIVRDTWRIGLVPEAALRRAVPPDDAFVVYTSSHPRHDRSPGYDGVHADLSIPRILRIIERLRPATVILASQPQSNDLALPLCPPDRSWRFVFEPNDITLVYGDALRELVPMSREHLHRCHLAEAWALRHADMTVTNCLGPRWTELLETLGGHARQFFSSAGIETPGTVSAGRPIRILYAGGIPQAYLRDAWKTDYRFLALLSELAGHDGIEVDVFNAHHPLPEQDARYDDVMAFAGPGLRYHRAQPFEQILAASAYSFGWLHRGDIPRRQPGEAGAGNDVMVLNKRFTAYVAAGLPVIIDDQLDAMADLVERFGAGLVLPAGPLDAGDTAARLEAADRRALAQGVTRLREHLVTANEDTLAALRALIGGTGEGNPACGRDFSETV